MNRQKWAVSSEIGLGGSMWTPEQLAAIGSIAGAEASIELTSFKQLYLSVPEERGEAVRQALLEHGLRVSPVGSYVKRLIACPFCRGAEEAGLELARELDEAIADLPAPSPLKIGYAGCALGTSEPLLKDIGVVKMRDAYDVYVGGEPKGLKAATAKLLVSGLPREKVVPVVTRLIAVYQELGKKKEKFASFVGRMTVDGLRERAGL